MSASVLRSGGCNAFATTELPSQCAVEGVRRHWRSTRNKSSLSSVSSRTSRCGRSFPRCTSGESQEAAAHSRDSSLVTASPSKKSLRAAERQRADVARARRRWIREQGLLDPARLVFIDETAVSTNLARLKGRAPKGVRVIGTVPLGSWQTITFVAALRHNKMTAPMVIEGAMNGEIFLAYVEQCLVPRLRRNDNVVMDNCRIPLAPAIAQAIEKAQASVRYLPKYSPDLNPIELPYSK